MVIVRMVGICPRSGIGARRDAPLNTRSLWISALTYEGLDRAVIGGKDFQGERLSDRTDFEGRKPRHDLILVQVARALSG